MMNFYFKTAAGHVFVGVGKDVDRARSEPSARLVPFGRLRPSALRSGTPFKAFPDRKEVSKMFAFLVAVLAVLATCVISFFGTALLIWLICWAFALTFSWKITFGIWIIICILRSIFKTVIHRD